jgi:hypothetical protein
MLGFVTPPDVSKSFTFASRTCVEGDVVADRGPVGYSSRIADLADVRGR